MPKTKQPTADKKCWSESFGFYGAKIRIAERAPGGRLYLLWLDKQGKQQKRSLGHRDRKEARKQALELASALAEAYEGGAWTSPAVVDTQISTGCIPGQEVSHGRTAKAVHA